ncbi:hypothetical protein VN97_g200 [Penicillium thymicola]|uniref:Uncharacterized protein n=1 Tax=Penicillium thymicola TaxID=293382 RepID=A0AAI9TVI1_PENTH|nr:hypothetical protein VN97_g200 [Penicillium thymicola]
MFRWTFGHYFPESRHAEIFNDALTAETPRLGGGLRGSPHLPNNSPIRAHNPTLVTSQHLPYKDSPTPILAAKGSANFLQIQFIFNSDSLQIHFRFNSNLIYFKVPMPILDGINFINLII